jgi:putative hydrolase of the HAD superfamily
VELAEREVVLVIASNWDCSLPDWLRATGVLDFIDAVVTSAEVGEAKPSPRVFERALALARVDPGEALHVGDKVDNDVAGAAAAGVRGVLIQREGEPPPGVEAIRSFSELLALL